MESLLNIIILLFLIMSSLLSIIESIKALLFRNLIYFEIIYIYINRNVFHSFKFKHSWSKFVKIYVKIVGIKHTF